MRWARTSAQNRQRSPWADSQALQRGGGAMGAAIIAASQTHFASLTEAAKALTQIEKEVYPQLDVVEIYKQNYQQFIDLLAGKGYISKTVYA